MSQYILGISAFYHDSAAAIIKDDEIIAAAQEERFTRKKHDSGFPSNAVKYVLEEAGIDGSQISCLAFYDKPFIKFERLLETYHAFVPKGLVSFWSAMPVWIKEKLFLKKVIRDELKNIGFNLEGKILYPEHHLSHAASAFFPSPFEDAAILTVDGVGEWATSTICKGNGNSITILRELDFPHSVGLLYSAFTYYLGFRVNSGEYKLMGLAPYGIPLSDEVEEFKRKILTELVDLREDGSILLNMKYFDYATGLKMTNNRRWQKLFGFGPRKEEYKIEQHHMNLALAIQQITEEIMIRMARTAKRLTGSNNLVMAGGVALNCVANGKILDEKIFENIWVQPAAGDAGGALGAALSAWYIYLGKKRIPVHEEDAMKGSYLGPSFGDKEVEKIIHKFSAPYEKYSDFASLCSDIAVKMAGSNVIGWFQGRMEYGPRALGNRSILGDPRDPAMQKKLNLKIKYREGFRPFAPAVLAEDISQHFKLEVSSPYMLLVVPINEKLRNTLPANYYDLELYDRLYIKRSELPAITHLDFSARVQTVSKKTNPEFHQLISAFKRISGSGVVVNTSFNVRGEPIVCTPEEAYLCFMRTDMDFLVLGNYVFAKSEQNQELAAKLKKIKIGTD
jgi:carbamoyltransferase